MDMQNNLYSEIPKFQRKTSQHKEASINKK